MARAATTTDAFNAVAEPRRRQILDVLAGGELSVTELVGRLGLSQPLVSKHLRVLREVGLVRRARRGTAAALPARRPAAAVDHRLARPYERAVSERFDLMDGVIEELKTQEADDDDDDELGEGHAPTDTQILITREFDAPKHLVWKAYTTPELVARWWGGGAGRSRAPRSTCGPAARWRYVMTANGGFEVAFHGEYREVSPTDRLVHTEISRARPRASA